MKLRRELLCHITAVAVCLLVVAPIVISVLDRVPPFELSDGESFPKQIEPGGSYATKWRVRLMGRTCDSIVYRDLVDAQSVVWTNEPATSLFAAIHDDRKEFISVGRSRQMPNGVALGRMEIRTRTVSVCNWTHHIWPITVTHPVVLTEIVPKASLGK